MSVMPPEIRTDDDSLILEDLDFSPACEVQTTTCDVAATWALRRTCCSDITMFCDEHRTHVEKWINDNGKLLYASFTCHACNTSGLKTEDFYWEKL